MINTTKMPLWAAVLACVLAVSCDTPTSGDGSGSVYREPDVVLGTNQFWAYNSSNNNYYRLTAEKKAVGQRCEVWVEKGAGISSSDAREIAAEYDNTIYQVIRNAFNTTLDVDVGGGVKKQMGLFEIADYITNEDGKLLLLLLDIRDTYSPPADNAYVGGYFDGNNFLNNPYSNRADMLYVDIKPGTIKSKQFYAVIAHELQHLLHFVIDLGVRTPEGATFITEQDLWINEGLSTASEYLYLGDHAATKRIDDFNKDAKILAGNTFFVWDGALADYATAYLFFQWLRIQAGSTAIYRDIFMSQKLNYQAVTEAAASRIDTSYANWETLLYSWFAANYIKASSGPYGYNGEISGLEARFTSGSTKTIQLRPGEGVYSALGSVPANSGNIHYASLTAESVTVTLTYNVNTVKAGAAETGTIAASQLPADTISASRAAAASREPYPIGITDLLGGRRPGGVALPDDAFSGRISGFVLNPDE
ncbi:MAG: hypothetical protein LBK62_01735 [Treponema sp.]|jgi:hypothetical protein|nr:hypothetical protein [Treponema sp.]